MSFNFAKVKVVTLNVNGLKDSDKRRNIFHFLKSVDSNVILLQETHSTISDEKMWSNEWGSHFLFSHGTNMARGVALIFQRNFPVQIENVNRDNDGRYMIVDLNINEIKMVFACVYAPNEDNPNFFVKFFDQVDGRDNDSLMLGGDFNTTLDPSVDLYNNAGTNHVKKRQIIKEFMHKKNLTDIWRMKNPDILQYSWRKPFTKNVIMSRLDHFLISQDLVLRTNNVAIKPKYISDHSRVELELDLNQSKRGKGIWKFNNTLLNDPKFVSKMNETITRERYEVKNF